MIVSIISHDSERTHLFLGVHPRVLLCKQQSRSILHSLLLILFTLACKAPFLLFLRPVQTVLYIGKASLILPLFPLVDHVQSVRENGQDDIKQEERANDDERGAEDDCHPRNIRIHQVVHDDNPALKRNHLKDGQQSPAQIIKTVQSVENQAFVILIVNSRG